MPKDPRDNYWPPPRERRILACIPVDRSKLPQGPELDAIVITDLYTLRSCVVEGCGDVWIGPRQLAEFKADPDGFVIMCHPHAVAVVMTMNGGAFAPEEDVVELGGGYPVEGRARIA